MRTLEEVEADIQALPLQKQEELRDWLENLLEDRLVLKEDFKNEIQAGIKDIAEGKYRVRKPWILQARPEQSIWFKSFRVDFILRLEPSVAGFHPSTPGWLMKSLQDFFGVFCMAWIGRRFVELRRAISVVPAGTWMASGFLPTVKTVGYYRSLLRSFSFRLRWASVWQVRLGCIQILCAFVPLWLKFSREAADHAYGQVDRRTGVHVAGRPGGAELEAAHRAVRAIRVW
jgi:hypothetical protein